MPKPKHLLVFVTSGVEVVVSIIYIYTQMKQYRANAEKQKWFLDCLLQVFKLLLFGVLSFIPHTMNIS
jgi:hypothetical protein